VQAAHSSSSSRSPLKQRHTPHTSPLKQQHQQQQLQSRSPQRQLFTTESVTELSVSEAVAAASDSSVTGDTPPVTVTAVTTLQSAVAAAVGDVSSVAGQLAAVGKQFDMQVKRLQVTLLNCFALHTIECTLLLPLLLLLLLDALPLYVFQCDHASALLLRLYCVIASNGTWHKAAVRL
jgi:hypothetical protein